MLLYQEYNKLTDICNDFKTKTNINTNYIEYISALIYLKYYESYSNQTFRRIYEDRDNYYISEKIDKAISDMRDNIGDEKIFSDIQFSNIVFYRKLGEKNILAKIIEEINEMCNIFPKNYIAEQYELALKQIAIIGDMKSSNELFYTPMEITNAMVNMIVDKKSADVYDPMCSSGNFLINASKLNDKKIKIFGQEENIEYYNILKTRILLNDIEDEEIEYQNNEKNKKIKFDYIFLNPPYSKKNWKEIIKYRPIFEEYEISENSVGDYAFVISILDNLKDDGKMAVLLPHGVLFRENERKVRKNLVEKNEIEAIIGLPENLFYDTRIPVIMMIIAKNKVDKNILFMAPTNAIKDQMYRYIAKYIAGEEPTTERPAKMIAEEQFPNLRIILYPSLLRMKNEIMENLNPDIIIMDELHRTGADKWGEKIDDLINMNPNAKILGLTATPDRMDDKNIVDDTGKVLKDVWFNSASSAAQFVTGNSTNGMRQWKTIAEGKSLNSVV